MSTAKSIRRYINLLPADEIFSTREILHFGSRASVDQSMYRLVFDGKVRRLAYGLFIRSTPGMKMPSMHKIAAAKAKAFDKELFTHGHDAAFELGIVNKPNKKTIFYVPGSATSSFLCLTIMHRVHTKAAAARRLYAGNTRVGKAIRALWELGPEKINSMALQKASMNLNREEIRTLRLAAFRVPWWLAKYTNFVATIAGQVVY